MIDNPSIKSKQLLAEFASGKITQEELDKECAYWFLDCFDELHPKPLPTMPQRFQNFKNLTFEEQRSIPKEFWYHPEVKEYLDQKQSVIQENKSNLFNLHKCLNHIPEGDFVSRQKFHQKINEFEY